MLVARALGQPSVSARSKPWRVPSCRVLRTSVQVPSGHRKCCVSTGREPTCRRLVTFTSSPVSYELDTNQQCAGPWNMAVPLGTMVVRGSRSRRVPGRGIAGGHKVAERGTSSGAAGSEKGV